MGHTGRRGSDRDDRRGELGHRHQRVLNGTVNAHGSPTGYTFEYGPTNAFGSISAVDSAGSTNGSNPYALPIAGLSPNTQYRFRIVATNANGTARGTVGSCITGSGT